ncbi:TVP38/TMEM64 family protein [Alkalihalophilus lindianensis]|uniref:TVP38/TMEM64 family membrane protein n=1 Tax=Alkalihalophilus lindianensis TaxID=1630542 RepID=A0ABU3X9B6_9BACI|nr:TVP38/TMEM64 family protein [Alkalihalophilus lindianensis]MDV2683928.1 TVP38/TMEM64 family protein [Alkalihalophilus lindianensis]
MIKKVFILSSYALIALLIYLYGESLLHWIREGGTNYLLLTAILATLFALFPIIPYPIIGGVLGAAYGPLLGSLMTWIGSSLASIIMFSFVRYGYQDWGLRLLQRYRSLNKITTLFERNAFMTIFITRLIPVIPSIIVNIYSALSRVRFLSYAIASSLGKVPSMILFAVVGNSFVNDPSQLMMIAFYYLLFLVAIYSLYRLWQKFAQTKEKLPEL